VEEQHSKDRFEDLHYVQMILDNTLIDIFRKFQGNVPKNNREIVKLIEDNVKLIEDNQKMLAKIEQLE